MESMIIFSAKEIGRVTYSNQNILDIVAEELPDIVHRKNHGRDDLLYRRVAEDARQRICKNLK